MRIVVKFGGTSLGSIEKIRKAADIIKNLKKANHEIVVVASAMANTTNTLVEYTQYFYMVNNSLEYDAVISAGEQISAGLLAMAIQEKGFSAKSLLAWQLPVFTDKQHMNAKINSIEVKKLNFLLNNDIIPVIAGFQGITEEYNLTTLGRGGGDTTAVAVAIAVKADCCYIYTDVDGVFTGDPRIVKTAVKLNKVCSTVMIEMATSGAKILHPRSLELAHKNHLPLYVKSTFNDNSGTYIINEDEIMEKPIVNAVVSTNNEVLFQIKSPVNNEVTFSVLDNVLSAGIAVDMLQNYTNNESAVLTFTISRDNLEAVNKIIDTIKPQLGDIDIQFNTEISKISIVGVGLCTHQQIMQRMFKIIAKNAITIHSIALANLKITMLCDEALADFLINLLHQEYQEYFYG